MISGITLSFFAFLLMFVAIGVWSATRRSATPEDYLLASRSVSPWFTALSSVATDNSGFMFIGLTAECYTNGVSGGWLIIGWIFGEWIAWSLVHQRLREDSERCDVNTITSYLGHGLEHGRLVAILAAIITLVFLGVYASAQLNAGRKALELFGIRPVIGVFLGAGIVLVYCYAGGIRASIWTDVAQSIIMLAAMLLLVGIAVHEIGGFGALWHKLGAIEVAAEDGTAASAGLTSWLPEGLAFGFGPFILGWIFAGLGMVGQPHIMIRAMAIDSADNVPKARRIYITWYLVFALCCIMVGLVGRVLIAPDSALLSPGGTFDSELLFPGLSASLLPGVLVGLMLAGVFAATISTADSQVLSCSAALTQDLVPSMGRSYTGVKIGTALVVVVALGLALAGGSVFQYVLFAWTALAGSLAPLMFVRVMRWPVTTPAALTMMLGGLGAVLYWKFSLKWSSYIYEALPGMCMGLAIYGGYLLVRAVRRQQRDQSE